MSLRRVTVRAVFGRGIRASDGRDYVVPVGNIVPQLGQGVMVDVRSGVVVSSPRTAGLSLPVDDVMRWAWGPRYSATYPMISLGMLDSGSNDRAVLQASSLDIANGVLYVWRGTVGVVGDSHAYDLDDSDRFKYLLRGYPSGEWGGVLLGEDLSGASFVERAVPLIVPLMGISDIIGPSGISFKTTTEPEDIEPRISCDEQSDAAVVDSGIIFPQLARGASVDYYGNIVGGIARHVGFDAGSVEAIIKEGGVSFRDIRTACAGDGFADVLRRMSHDPLITARGVRSQLQYTPALFAVPSPLLCCDDHTKVLDGFTAATYGGYDQMSVTLQTAAGDVDIDPSIYFDGVQYLGTVSDKYDVWFVNAPDMYILAGDNETIIATVGDADRNFMHQQYHWRHPRNEIWPLPSGDIFWAISSDGYFLPIKFDMNAINAVVASIGSSAQRIASVKLSSIAAKIKKISITNIGDVGVTYNLPVTSVHGYGDVGVVPVVVHGSSSTFVETPDTGNAKGHPGRPVSIVAARGVRNGGKVLRLGGGMAFTLYFFDHNTQDMPDEIRGVPAVGYKFYDYMLQ